MVHRHFVLNALEEPNSEKKNISISAEIIELAIEMGNVNCFLEREDNYISKAFSVLIVIHSIFPTFLRFLADRESCTYGYTALLPETRKNSRLHFPLRKSLKIDKVKKTVI